MVSLESKLFSALTKAELTGLFQAKSEMSAKYLAGQQLVRGMTRSFRAAPTSLVTHNVVGVGIDEKYVNAIPTGTLVVKFLVRSKVQSSALSNRERLPTSVDGIPTDVEEVGLIVPLARRRSAKAAPPDPRARIRPAQPGCSIGFREPNDQFKMAGTCGAVVKDSKGEIYILSNNHVLAFENGVEANGTKRAALLKGAPIFQPGLMDGGKISSDQIAELSRWVDLRADRNDNLVDAAIARVSKADLVSRDVLFIGTPNDVGIAAKDMIVHKFGRTTSYRAGRVSSTVFDITVPYEVGEVMFTDQIAIRGLNRERFSDSGDSGSAILDRSTNKIVGLLFAGATNGSLTFANHIADVLRLLNVKLV